MATALYNKGEKLTVDYTASGADVVVDEVVVIGDSVGVAFVALADGETGTADIGGCYIFPKVSGAVIAAGETVDWHSVAGEVDDNASAAAAVHDFGVALESAGDGVTSIAVKLLPGNTPV